MKLNGTQKQNEWAEKILNTAGLTPEQMDNLLRYAGPKMHAAQIMDVTIVIENRNRLAEYADSLGRFYQFTPTQKREVAVQAANAVLEIAEVSEESDQFEKIDCLCGKSFEKIDFGDVQCPYCGQIWGVA